MFYGLYFFKRNSIIAKFEREKDSQRQSQARNQRGIKTWMRLYYCDRDQGVFLPGQGELIPPEQMMGYLLK